MLFHRRGLLWLGSAVRYIIIDRDYTLSLCLSGNLYIQLTVVGLFKVIVLQLLTVKAGNGIEKKN